MSRMQQKLSAALLLVVGMLLAAPAAASFHLWFMTQLYTNASGSVQFLELTALAPEQQFVSFHSLKVSGGGVNHTYDVTTNLPGDTSGRKFLFGTQSFAALGIVQPDYIVPDNFFPIGGGTVNWADVDPWTYQPLPTDGVLALNRDNTTTTNAPTNFGGQSGTVTAGAGAANNYQALWWRSPAGFESGWGVNIAHQGNILFATWFTYDSSNKGIWVVMSDGEKQSGAATDTYTGALFITTGPAFNAQPFDPNAGPQHAGRHGDLQLHRLEQRHLLLHPERRLAVEADHAPDLLVAHARLRVGRRAAPPAELRGPLVAVARGRRIGLGREPQHQGNILFATWFTYDSTGKGLWVVMSDGEKTGNNTYSGALYTTVGPAFNADPWDPKQVQATQVGTGTFTFSDANNGTFAYTLNGISQTKSITRQVFRHRATSAASGGTHETHRSPRILPAPRLAAGIRAERHRPRQHQLPGPVVEQPRRLPERLGHQHRAPGRHPLRHLVHL